MDGLTAESLVEPGTFFRMGNPPIIIDILPEISGIDFKAALSRAVHVAVNEVTGLQAPFISATDFIANKIAAGRPSDLADAVRLAQKVTPDYKKTND